MKIRLFCSILSAGLSLGAGPLLSHEFWIEPEKFQVDSGEAVTARLYVGQKFSGAEQPYLDHRIARFDVMRGTDTIPYQGRLGDMPAFSETSDWDGLVILVHQTQPRVLTYDTWEEFQAFTTHKGFTGIEEIHKARGLPDSGFTEQYSRYAKSLIASGSGKGSGIAAGLETEILALANPYTDDIASGMPVRVLLQGMPREGAQIEIFSKAPDGTVAISTLLTDGLGEAVIPVDPGHQYLLDAVVLRSAPEGEDHVWESLWASLTFAVPAE